MRFLPPGKKPARRHSPVYPPLLAAWRNACSIHLRIGRHGAGGDAGRADGDCPGPQPRGGLHRAELFTAVDPDELQRASEELMAAARPELDWLYGTRCDRCGGPARTAYTVYSERFCCPHCQQTTPLADCPQVSTGSKKTAACPRCLARGHVEAIRTRGPRNGAVPVLAAYRCLGGCLPSQDQRRTTMPTRRNATISTRYDLGKIEEITGREIPHWLPATAFSDFLRPLADGPPPGGRAACRRTCIRSGIFGPWPPYAPRR